MELLLTLASILMVNILLSGDNALVIALASRDLPAKHKKMATILGSAGAVALRIVLTFIAVYLLTIPYLKLVGGLLLFWIAVKLLSGDEDGNEVAAKDHLWGAVQTIIIADLVMSLDNVVAIAGVAKGDMTLIVVGLVISVPIVIWGSNLIGLLMKKWPITIVVGAAVLGWTAGEMVLGEKRIEPLFHGFSWSAWLIPGLFAVAVVLVGTILAKRNQGEEDTAHATQDNHQAKKGA